MIDLGQAVPRRNASTAGLPYRHDPGGKALPLPNGVVSTAVFGGPGDCYRYRLDWAWDAGKPRLLAGMMNPSAAGPDCGDMTVAWVQRWAAARGFGALTVVNASAYRCRKQARLAEIADPMGPDNEWHILAAAEQADLVVLGYGQPKVRAARDHGPRMARLLREAGVATHVWGLSLNGTPKHPLYLPGCTAAVPWTVALPTTARPGRRR